MIMGRQRSMQLREDECEEDRSARRWGLKMIGIIAAVIALAITLQLDSPHSAYHQRGTAVNTSVQ